VNRLVTSASTGGPRAGLLRDDLPQFAFTGRSNVGKSSLINALLREKLARTSAAAGKTRQANIFEMKVAGGLGHPGSWSAYVVDLPGYGYARGGHASAQELATVVEAYLAALRGDGRAAGPGVERRGAIFLLVDSRHPGLASDLEAFRWLSSTVAMPYVIATKIDKLSQRERSQHLREFTRLFDQTPLAVASATGEGIDQLRRLLAKLRLEPFPPC
jgi:GTP-binding protein